MSRKLLLNNISNSSFEKYTNTLAKCKMILAFQKSLPKQQRFTEKNPLIAVQIGQTAQLTKQPTSSVGQCHLVLTLKHCSCPHGNAIQLGHLRTIILTISLSRLAFVHFIEHAQRIPRINSTEIHSMVSVLTPTQLHWLCRQRHNSSKIRQETF